MELKCGLCGCEGVHACMGKPSDLDGPPIQPCTKKLEEWLDRAHKSITVGDPPLTGKQQAAIKRQLDRNDSKHK